MIEVARIPVLNDNYVWLVHDQDSGETAVVDPAVSDEVLDAAAANGWSIDRIWNTHWHPDHTGGNAAIDEALDVTIYAPRAEADRIATADVLVSGDDVLSLGAYRVEVIDVPAHTDGHIAYHIPEAKIVFVGDTLFAMGCGRLFEGTADQMFANMRKLEALPDDTTVYCAHEYTLANARYAVVAEPDNMAIAARADEVQKARDRGEATVPTTIALEKATNPFMRAGSVAVLAERRQAKDNF